MSRGRALCSSAVKFKEVDDTCGPQQDSFPGCVAYWPPVRALRLCLQRLSPQCPTQRAPWDSVSRQHRCGRVLPGRGAVTTAGTSSLGVPGPSPAASLEPELMFLGPLLVPNSLVIPLCCFIFIFFLSVFNVHLHSAFCLFLGQKGRKETLAPTFVPS